MPLFSSKKVKKTTPISGDQLLNPRDTIRIIAGDGLSIFGDVSKSKLLEWYTTVPEVFQVITTKARMFAKMDFSVRSKTTGEIVNNSLNQLVSNPNWYQSKKEFLTQDKIFREMYGNNYIHFSYPLGFDKRNTKQIFTLNPLFLDLKEPYGGLPPFMRSGYKQGTVYKYQYDGKVYTIDTEAVLHLNNNNTKNDKSTGISTLEPLKPNIENLISAYESRGVLLRTRGALGILSNNAKDETGAVLGFDPEDKKAIQKDYEKYGLTKNQWQLIITNLNLRFQKMAMSAKDLMIFEEAEEDYRKICDAFGFKAEMFSTESGSTFENARQYEKSAYQNTIIPEAQEYIDALNGELSTQNESYTIVGEFSGLEIFSEDKKDEAETIQIVTNSLSTAYSDKAITLEEYQKVLREKWRFE